MVKAVKEKKVLLVTWLLMMITKCYSILFSTFWLLFILSEPGMTNEEAEKIYKFVMIISIVCGVAFVPLVGKLADGVNPQIMLPAACFTRFLSIVGFYMIKDVSSIYAYAISIVMVLGTLMETVCTDAVLFRNADREIRGTIFGMANAFGFLGQFLFSLAGGYLFDEYNSRAPFGLVGACDLTLCILCIVLSVLGVIKNDISERADD